MGLIGSDTCHALTLSSPGVQCESCPCTEQQLQCCASLCSFPPIDSNWALWPDNGGPGSGRISSGTILLALLTPGKPFWKSACCAVAVNRHLLPANFRVFLSEICGDGADRLVRSDWEPLRIPAAGCWRNLAHLALFLRITRLKNNIHGF